MGTMAKQPDEQLLELLHDEFDDDVRAVCRFGSDGCESVFVRSDLGHHRSAAVIADRCERLVTEVDGHRIDGLVPPTAGEPECLIGLVGHLIVVVLYRTSTMGIVVTIDRGGGFPRAAFIDDCLATLR